MTFRVIGLGGTYRPSSSTEHALRIALSAAARLGAQVELLGAEALDLPMYRPGAELPPGAARLVDAVRQADALIVASPGYHGCISGLVKNALDYLEELRDDPRPYLDGKAVGCIAAAAGWQATMTTMASLRNVVHALRGWPTPFGAAINTSEARFSPDGVCTVEAIGSQLALVGEQVMRFAALGQSS